VESTAVLLYQRWASGDGPGAAGGSMMTKKIRDQDQEHSNNEASLPAVSANTLARCLGVAPKVVYDLAKAGIINRGIGRVFPLEESVRLYCEHLRRQIGGSR